MAFQLGLLHVVDLRSFARMRSPDQIQDSTQASKRKERSTTS